MSYIKKPEGKHVFESAEVQGQFTETNRASVTKSDNYTVLATDSGKIIDVDTDAKTITLPATVLGLTVTIRNAGADGAVAVTVSPAAADKIVGNGEAGVDNKDIVNTKATAKNGDYVTLVGDGADGWYIQAIKGTWAAEA